MILFLLLFLSLFLLFYCLLLGDSVADSAKGIKEWFRRFTIPVVSAGIAFLLGMLVCRTPLAGVIWAVMGWLLPGKIGEIVLERRKSVLRNSVKSFIAAAAGLYAAGQVTPEVLMSASMRFSEPLAGEFQVMLGRRNTDRKASFPLMFEGLAAKYGMPEFKAMAAIIAASERAGGPRAAAEGLKQLSVALRDRDRRLQERTKENLEPMLAAGVAIALILLGFLADVTVLSHYYSAPAGRIVLSATSALILIMVLVVFKATDSKDLAGGE